MYHKTEQDIMQHWKGDVDTPLVSICTITYNHENFIAEALDSFLMQETDFPFEIVVDDDCSPDGTVKVINKYIEKYPNIMNVKLRDKNVGSMTNFTENMHRANGKYIAICEGDDYWIDPLKLQTQVDLLINNNSLCGAATQSRIIDKDNNIGQFGSTSNKIYKTKDLLNYRPFHTASVVLRKGSIKMLDDRFKMFISGDKFLFIISSLSGNFYYDKNCCTAYRKHNGGMSSSGFIKDRAGFIKNNLIAISYLTDMLNYRDLSQLKYFEYSKYFIYNVSGENTFLNFIKTMFFSIAYLKSNIRNNLLIIKIFFDVK